MFYRPEDGHGLALDPLNAVVAPRPIAWVATRDAAGRANLAPFSYFALAAHRPPQVMFAVTGSRRGGEKDSLANIRATGVFSVNLTSGDLLTQVNATGASLPADVDEFSHAGVARADCAAIDCPRVAAAPATLECSLSQILPLEGAGNLAIFGRVVGVHLRDDLLRDGRFDSAGARLGARLGYKDYAVISEIFEMDRPE